jgi:tetratricopeptide (TPR) repeat protein
MPFRRRLRTAALLAFLAAASIVPAPARAQDAGTREPQTPAAPPSQNSGPTPSAPSSADVAAARVHFERARADYGQGSYREAVGELEAAHSLDPTAKDLVFNLGVVHEKLSDIDDALEWFQLYTTMTLTPTERERADSYIRRLEGAKKELALKPAAPPPAPGTDQAQPGIAHPARRVPSPSNGRVDAATVTAVSVAGAALVFGAVMAGIAEAERPNAGYVTGQDGSITDLQDRVDKAHREAVIADIAFGASLAAGVTAAILYFARTRDPSRAARTSGAAGALAPPDGSTFVSATPLTGGGALIVQGSL